MAVTRLTREEIAQAGFGVSINTSPVAYESIKPARKANQPYVDMISDEKIEKFFSKYKSLGYVAHQRDDESKSIRVVCNDFEVLFNDFTATVGPRTDIPTTQMYDEFNFTCGVAGATPDEVVTSLLANELFGSLPYYTEKKHKHDENNLKALKNSPFKDIVGPAISAKTVQIEQPKMKKMYGSDSLEDIAYVINSVRTLS